MKWKQKCMNHRQWLCVCIPGPSNRASRCAEKRLKRKWWKCKRFGAHFCRSESAPTLYRRGRTHVLSAVFLKVLECVKSKNLFFSTHASEIFFFLAFADASEMKWTAWNVNCFFAFLLFWNTANHVGMWNGVWIYFYAVNTLAPSVTPRWHVSRRKGLLGGLWCDINLICTLLIYIAQLGPGLQVNWAV